MSQGYSGVRPPRMLQGSESSPLFYTWRHWAQKTKSHAQACSWQSQNNMSSLIPSPVSFFLDHIPSSHKYDRKFSPRSLRGLQLVCGRLSRGSNVGHTPPLISCLAPPFPVPPSHHLQIQHLGFLPPTPTASSVSHLVFLSPSPRHLLSPIIFFLNLSTLSYT